MWKNLTKNEINTLVKFHNEHPERSIKRVNAQKIERITRKEDYCLQYGYYNHKSHACLLNWNKPICIKCKKLSNKEKK